MLAAVQSKGTLVEVAMSACEVCAGEQNFELVNRTIHAARELICCILGGKRPRGSSQWCESPTV